MLRSLLILCVVAVVGVSTPAAASDVLVDVAKFGPLTNAIEAGDVCPKTCQSYECAWSGEWRPGDGGQVAVCDCGIKRTRYVPGGYTPTQKDAESICPETCALNGDKWGGTVSGAPGGYDMCGCTYVSDYCPTDQK